MVAVVQNLLMVRWAAWGTVLLDSKISEIIEDAECKGASVSDMEPPLQSPSEEV